MIIYKASDFDFLKLDDVDDTPKERVEFDADAPDVDIEKFGLREKIIELITEGWKANGYRSRSEADEAIIVALLSKGATPEEIRGIFQNRAIGDKYREKGRYADDYLSTSIANAKAYIEREAANGTSKAEKTTDEEQRTEESKAESADAKSKKNKPRLNAGDRDLESITGATLRILKAANDPPFIFRSADMVSRVQKSEDGATVIRSLSEDALRHILAQLIHWFVVKEKKDEKIVASELPPLHVVRDILAMPEPPFPVINRAVRAPIFAADGSLRTRQGYDAATKTFYDPVDGFNVSVPPIPSDDDVTSACDTIKDLLFDFPFTSESEKTHAVGLLLLPFARELIDGPTPLHLIEKPSPGTGAGLLTDVLTTVFLGHGAATMTEGKDEDEWRKRITAKLVQHNDIVVIDNVRRRLESSALSAALTCNIWEDRFLGKTAMVRAIVRMVWIATGNNPALSNEIARRTVRIRLDGKVDRPWLREGFKHANLREYATKERAKLVRSALVLIQNWLTKGKPEGSKLLGTFENWARVIGGIVETAGFLGFLGNLEELYEASDAEGEAWRTLVTRWWEAHGDKNVGVSELFALIAPTDADPIDIDLGKDSERSQKTKLGQKLKQIRDRQFERKRIIQGDKKNGAQQWKLQDITINKQ